jgi:hypothetical protein
MHTRPSSSSSPEPRFRSLSRKPTELSILSSRSQINSYLSTTSAHPISLLMLESYLNEICKSISSSNSVTDQLHTQVQSMRNLLNDCIALSSISLEFYRNVESALNLVCRIHEDSDLSLIPSLVQLLCQVFGMIKNYSYIPNKVSVPVRAMQNSNLEEYLQGLKQRIGRLTTRVVMVLDR